MKYLLYKALGGEMFKYPYCFKLEDHTSRAIIYLCLGFLYGQLEGVLDLGTIVTIHISYVKISLNSCKIKCQR